MVVDEFQLPEPGAAPAPLWQWDAQQRRLFDVHRSVADRLHAWAARAQPLPLPLPLAVAVAWDGPELVLRWHMSSSGVQRFTLVAADQALPVPPGRAAMCFAKPLPPCFRLRADTADGRIAYKPWLRLDMPRGARTRVEWQGVGESAAAVRAAARCPAA